ncbi:MAG: protein phosphatase 2C domain-containing protein [Crenarchaeota archaeon]|nr:protein phosphatase 2C domain-containing protein [Thermoproteota archaeon]
MNKMAWSLIGSSVQGYSHIRSNKKNQDSFLIYPNDLTNDPPIIFALADGHGGDKYFLSDVGSKFAVESAIKVIKEFLQDPGIDEIDQDNIEFFNKYILDTVCQDIVKHWRKRVFDQNISDDKLYDSVTKQGEKNRPSESEKKLEPYGSTLLISFIFKNLGVFIQLGDGDIIILYGKDTIVRPIPKDENLIANDTYSLCLPGAGHYFKVSSILFNENFKIDDILLGLPSLIMLSTDGYSNSYISDDSFNQVAIDIYKMISENPNGFREGIQNIKDNLESWLTETSKSGSGDDITVGLMVHIA